MELEELKRLRLVKAKEILSKPVEPLGTEYDVVKDALVGIKSVHLAQRDFRLPGLERHTELVCQVVAEFKEKKKRNVLPLQYAKADDIVVAPIRPEDIGADNWNVSSAAAGIIHVIKPDGTPLTVDTENQVFVITDVLIGDPSLITAVQFTVDGVKQNPIEVRTLQVGRGDNLGIAELDYPVVADASLLMDVKAEGAVTTTVVPFGVHICLGRKLAALT
ncbi:MAG: hypothetical protein QXT26_02700 [Thermoproteota archaeon]